MKFKKIEDYLVYIQENKICKIVVEKYDYSVYRKAAIKSGINVLEDITNISFVSKVKIVSSLEQNNKNIYVIDVYIGMRIEFEYEECISREFIEIEKGELFKSSECIDEINININTIAIGSNNGDITISIIYSLYI